MKYEKLEIVLDKLVRGQSYLTYPHHNILPFGNSDNELEGTECDNKFWDWYGTVEDGGTRVAYPYPTHVCLEFKFPDPPND